LLGCLSPVFQGHGPLLADITVGQINQFLQRRVIGENPFVLCHLANLAMISLHRVGGVDQSPDGVSILLLVIKIFHNVNCCVKVIKNDSIL